MSDLEILNKLEGQKVKEIKLEWNDSFDDYYIDYIVFEDGSELHLWGEDHCARFQIENRKQ